MSKLIWDEVGKRTFETGVDHGILFPLGSDGNYEDGVAWNGLTGVTESPSGAEVTSLYADNIKYLNMTSAEEFGGTITAYTYPEEFALCDGSAELTTGVYIGQQARKNFGLFYRTRLGNDTQGDSYGYKYHFVYGATASPSQRDYKSVNDSPEGIEFSWEFKTSPVNVTGWRPVSSVTIDSSKADPTKLAALLEIVEGSDGTPTYTEVTPVGTENPRTEGWYEKIEVGSQGAYVYQLTTDTTVNNEKTYYNKTTTGGTDARLPLPDEIKTIMTAAG